MTEADIWIGDNRLTAAQSAAVRVALTERRDQLEHDFSEAGEAHALRLDEVLRILAVALKVRKRRSFPKQNSD